MMTPMAMLATKKQGAVWNDTNSIQLPGTPVCLLHFDGNMLDETGAETVSTSQAVYYNNGYSPAAYSTTARFGQSLMYNGIGSIVLLSLGGRTIPISTSTGVTFMAWVRFSADVFSHGLLQFSDGVNALYIALHQSEGNFAVTVQYNNTDTFDAAAAWTGVAIDTWHLITVSLTTTSGGLAYISLNGDVQLATQNGEITAAPYAAYDGIHWLLSSPTMLMDEFAITQNYMITSDFTPPALPWRV